MKEETRAGAQQPQAGVARLALPQLAAMVLMAMAPNAVLVAVVAQAGQQLTPMVTLVETAGFPEAEAEVGEAFKAAALTAEMAVTARLAA